MFIAISKLYKVYFSQMQTKILPALWQSKGMGLGILLSQAVS
jgi:hypothetical protein